MSFLDFFIRPRVKNQFKGQRVMEKHIFEEFCIVHQQWRYAFLVPVARWRESLHPMLNSIACKMLFKGFNSFNLSCFRLILG